MSIVKVPYFKQREKIRFFYQKPLYKKLSTNASKNSETFRTTKNLTHLEEEIFFIGKIILL